MNTNRAFLLTAALLGVGAFDPYTGRRMSLQEKLESDVDRYSREKAEAEAILKAQEKRARKAAAKQKARQ